MQDPPVSEVPSAPAAEDSSAGAPGVWGLWPTLGWSAILLVFWTTAQMLGAFLYLGWIIFEDPELARKFLNPAATQHFLEGLVTNGFAVSLMTILGAPAALGGAAGLVKLRGFFLPTLSIAEYLGLRGCSWKQFVFWILATQALAVVYSFLGQAMERPETPDFVRDVYASAGSPALLFFAIVVCAPLAEEVLFRGFLYPGLARSRGGPWLAIALPALIWGALHLQYDWFDLSYVMAMGFLFGAARWKSDSLYVPLLMHVYNNGVAMLAVSMLEDSM